MPNRGLKTSGPFIVSQTDPRKRTSNGIFALSEPVYTETASFGFLLSLVRYLSPSKSVMGFRAEMRD